MRLTDFKALTFDCYGTLIDWESGILAELKPWAAGHGLSLSDNEILENFAAAESTNEQATPALPYPELLAATHRALARRWGIPEDEATARDFAGSVGRWPAFPDSPAALQYLKRHYKLVILSNVDRASFALSNRRLGVAFDRIITAQDVGSYKPDPRNFDYMLRELAAMGIAKGEILHTAQSRYHDMVPAKAKGLAMAWINRRKGKPGAGATPVTESAARPDFEVASMAELVTLHQAG